MPRERTSNPILGDDIILRLVTFNSQSLTNVSAVNNVQIFRLDPTLCSSENRDGRYLVQTIDGSEINTDSPGMYYISLPTSAPLFTIGKYIDSWQVVFSQNDNPAQVANHFEIYQDLWYTSTMPPVYGFNFEFQPNRIRKGSSKWLIVKITPNVQRATELQQYYTNLAITSNVSISMELNCGPCGPAQSSDCSLIIDDELICIRDKVFGYYKLDTTEDGLDLDCGIYDLTFKLEYADCIEKSPRMQLQIY